MCIRDSRSRARFATENLTQDNVNAYMTLYTAPVSYTHLDVYKRQLCAHAGGACVLATANQ